MKAAYYSKMMEFVAHWVRFFVHEIRIDSVRAPRNLYGLKKAIINNSLRFYKWHIKAHCRYHNW